MFGGQVAAQALVAAGRTVEPTGPVHSLHAYFLRPGDPTIPIIYEVDRIRDGQQLHDPARRRDPARPARSSTCGVVPDRRGRARPPDADARRARSRRRCRRSASASSRTATGSRRDVVEWLERERPIDSRPVERCRSWLDPGPRASREQDVWIRANGTLPDDPLLHACVVAYASDLTLLDTAMLPHAIVVRRRRVP